MKTLSRHRKGEEGEEKLLLSREGGILWAGRALHGDILLVLFFLNKITNSPPSPTTPLYIFYRTRTA